MRNIHWCDPSMLRQHAGRFLGDPGARRLGHDKSKRLPGPVHGGEGGPDGSQIVRGRPHRDQH